MNKIEKERDTLLTAVEKYKAQAKSKSEALGELLESKREAIRDMRMRMDEVTQATLLGGLVGLTGNALVLRITEMLKERIPNLVAYRKYLEAIVVAALLWLGHGNMVKSEQKRAFLRAAGMSMGASLITPFVNNMLGGSVPQLAISGAASEDEGVDDSAFDVPSIFYGAACSGIEPDTIVYGAETGVIPAALIPLLIQAGQTLAPIAQDQLARWQAEMRMKKPERAQRMNRVAKEGRQLLNSPAVQQELRRLMAQYYAQQPGFTPRPREESMPILPTLPGQLMPSSPEGTNGWGERMERRQERRQERRENVMALKPEASASTPVSTDEAVPVTPTPA